jgi:membrane fusion protein (multidrug efflux system)
VPVTVVTLRPETVTLTRVLPGRTRAYLVADVRPQANGIVKRRLFTEGGVVKAGAVLYEIDDALYRAQYQSSAAALARAEATAESARLSARRSANLIKIDAVSIQDNENAIAASRQAEADVAAARAALETSRVNLAYTRITSPISGRIGQSSVTPGALVLSGQTTALATVQQLDPIYVEVNQSSSEWLQLREEIEAGQLKAHSAGTSVGILLEDGTRYRRDGVLQFSDVTVDPLTGSFILRAIVANPDAGLLPGMYVRAVLNEGVRDDAVLAPQTAISRDPKGNATALVVGAGDKVELRAVKVARTIGDAWLVDAGLNAGDRVIVEGLQKVRPGVPVAATERIAAAAATERNAAAIPANL